ncbi:MAG TPA: heparinase II/III family protein, partial [Limnochordia bacterium]
FVLDALGVRWAEELGSDDYNLPGYFGSGRWDYYRKRTEGQNTLVINPSDDPGQDPLARARIIHFASRPGEAVAIADLTPAYRRDAVRVQRGIALLDQRRQVLIQDEIETRSPSEIWWFMHTRADVRLGADGRTALLERNGRRLSARILSPAEASFTVMEARPLPTSPDPAGQNPNSEVRKLAIRLDDVTKTTLAVQLVPLADEAFAPVPPELIPLEAWASAAGPDGLWPTLPRMAMRITSPPAGEAVHGRVPLGIDVELPEGLSLERVTVHLDEQVVYSGSGLPDGVALDTRTVADGPHRLTVTAALRGGGIAVEVVELMVQNTWSLRDPLEAPIDAGWFGTIDRTMSSAESGGWTYVGDDAAGLFGDESRKVRREDTQEWIVWETPHLKTFSVRLYARTEAIDPLVALAASADGEHWRALPYDVTLERAEGGWYALSLEGSTPSGRDPRWFRITLLPGELPADDIQIGQVELSGQHD